MTEQLRVLRLKEVRAKTGRSQSSIYADMHAGKFPRPIPIGGHSVGWLETEIDDWIRARVAERDGDNWQSLGSAAARAVAKAAS
jgi:prophage regulatory protein